MKRENAMTYREFMITIVNDHFGENTVSGLTPDKVLIKKYAEAIDETCKTFAKLTTETRFQRIMRTIKNKVLKIF